MISAASITEVRQTFLPFAAALKIAGPSCVDLAFHVQAIQQIAGDRFICLHEIRPPAQTAVPLKNVLAIDRSRTNSVPGKWHNTLLLGFTWIGKGDSPPIQFNLPPLG